MNNVTCELKQEKDKETLMLITRFLQYRDKDTKTEAKLAPNIDMIYMGNTFISNDS